MQPQTPETRVERLETRMGALEQLPDKVDALATQVDTLTTRVDGLTTRVDGLTTRVDGLTTKVDGLTTRMADVESQVSQLRGEMRGEFSAIRLEIRTGDDETRRVLGQQIEEQFERAGRHALVLHEHVIDRIKTIGEGNAGRS